jgi:Enoyl-(Acyl carrier protein) reductase
VIAVARRESDELREAIRAFVETRDRHVGRRRRPHDQHVFDHSLYRLLRLVGLRRDQGRRALPGRGARSQQTRITVNAVAPGFVDTELTQSLSEYQRQRIAGRSALRRLPETDDVARMVEYLLGDGGRNITGTILTIDAGNTP